MVKSGKKNSINERKLASGNCTHAFRHLLPVLALVCFSLTAFAGVHNDRWRWSNPLPHGNNVLDMKISGDFGLQVGDAGTVYVRRLDQRWTPVYTGVDNYLRSIADFGEQIVAVGENGMILWSDDGMSFQPAELSPPNTLDWFEGVTASGQRIVAVGDYGAIYTSTNGANWLGVTPVTEEWLRGVAAGAGGFVAVGENGTILRSPSNGTSWSLVTSPTTEHLNRVRFLGTGASGRFYAVGNNGTLLRSDTGTAPWTPMACGTTNHLYDVALNNAGLLVVGDEALCVSIDGGANWIDQINDIPTNAPPAWVYLSAQGKGDTWLVAGRTGLLMEGSCANGIDCVWQPSPEDSSHAWLWDMTVQSGSYIAVGDLANIKTSLDGILWAREVVPVSHTNTVLLGVGGTSNLLVAVGNEGNILISEAGMVDVTVTNDAVVTNISVQALGVIWTNLAPFTTGDLQGVAANDDVFIITGEAGAVYTSMDGTNWTERTTPVSSFLSGVAAADGVYVAVGSGGTLIRSQDNGTSWTPVSMGTTNWLYRVRWLDNRFVVTGENGSIYTSSDGTAWTQQTSGTTRWLTDVTFVDNQWYACGYQGTLLTSSNLVDWTELPLPTGKSLFAAASKEGQLMLAGIEGVTLRNQVISDPTPISILGYDYTHSVASNGVESVYELFLFGGHPDQFFDFQTASNLTDGVWSNLNGALELFDPSGTLYAIRTRDATNALSAEFYRTQLVP